MTQEEILIRALNLACKFIRKYPVANMEAYLNNGLIHCLAGGDKRDKDGLDYAMKFIDMATKGEDIK